MVSPPEMQHGYSEKLLVMPFTFQVSGGHPRARIIAFTARISQVTSHADEHPHPWAGSRDEVYAAP